MANYGIKHEYQGGYSSLNPSYGETFTGYHLKAGEMGAPTKPDTANQLQHVSQLLNQGIIPIEVGTLDPNIFEQIPKQHFQEIRRTAQLTGAKISLHAPIIEPSGMGEKGWSEINRELAERQLIDVVKKSVEMDKNGGMPITIHSSGLPGTEYKLTPEGKKIEKIIVVDQETGQMMPIEEERKFYPTTRQVREDVTPEKVEEWRKQGISPEEMEKKIYQKRPLKEGKILYPIKEIDSLNRTKWDNDLSQVIFYKEGADRILQENAIQIQHLMKQGKLPSHEELERFPELQQALGHVENASTYLENTQQHLSGMFNKAYKFGTEEEKRELEKAAEKFEKELPPTGDPMQSSKAIQGLIMSLKKVQPKLFVPVEEFAIKHSSETLSNVAFEAFDKFKDRAPKISVENMFPGMAFSMKKEGEDGIPGMKELILETKKKFVEKAINKGYSRGQAEEQADKMIGMTLDVGHLNIAKKKGFKDEDLRKEVAEIAKFVKHVHLTDNFGYSDSHLPPGMGNVPFKEILEELEKQGVMGDVRKIVEAGGWVQHFGTSPLLHSLGGMGSPVYAEGVGPYWNQTQGLYQNYFGGYGQMLPQINYETFGAGFSQLPAELGGQRGGAPGGRMSGRPME